MRRAAAAVALCVVFGSSPVRASQATPPGSAVAAVPQAPGAGRGNQPSPPVAAPRPAGAPDPVRTEDLIEPPGFDYNPEGRRDPFVSLLRRGIDARTGNAGPRPAGLAGLGVADITLRGTIRSRDGVVAIVQGSDQRTYIVRAGDRLLDGTVRTISQSDMVILQQVNDPLSLDKQREVRKTLRQAEAD